MQTKYLGAIGRVQLASAAGAAKGCRPRLQRWPSLRSALCIAQPFGSSAGQLTHHAKSFLKNRAVVVIHIIQLHKDELCYITVN
ncbi:MAG TPA: hypothetical protein VLC98_14405 [Phnomibacter sp.]|nr:hypothetical protein [Phnomibacter sp.]